MIKFLLIPLSLCWTVRLSQIRRQRRHGKWKSEGSEARGTNMEQNEEETWLHDRKNYTKPDV